VVGAEGLRLPCGIKALACKPGDPRPTPPLTERASVNPETTKGPPPPVKETTGHKSLAGNGEDQPSIRSGWLSRVPGSGRRSVDERGTGRPTRNCRRANLAEARRLRRVG